MLVADRETVLTILRRPFPPFPLAFAYWPLDLAVQLCLVSPKLRRSDRASGFPETYTTTILFSLRDRKGHAHDGHVYYAA